MKELEIINGICTYSLKLCYSYKEARTLINKCKSKHFVGHKKRPEREYFCGYCNKYHVTSHKLFIY